MNLERCSKKYFNIWTQSWTAEETDTGHAESKRDGFLEEVSIVARLADVSGCYGTLRAPLSDLCFILDYVVVFEV